MSSLLTPLQGPGLPGTEQSKDKQNVPAQPGSVTVVGYGATTKKQSKLALSALGGIIEAGILRGEERRGERRRGLQLTLIIFSRRPAECLFSEVEDDIEVVLRSKY